MSLGEEKGLSEPVIIGIAAATAVLLVALIVVLVIFVTPSIRERVMPYRNRSSWIKKDS